jgi:hypothetical protein
MATALFAVALSAPATRAELPPWVYGEQQRRAPVVVRLRVRQAERVGDEARVSGEVLRVWRQPRALTLLPGQTIRLHYNLSPRQGPGVVGPSSLPLPQVGETVTAWLEALPGLGPTFAPAAGGRSFGPSLESFREP